MITLEEYKNHLLNNIYEDYDNTPEKYQERLMHLKRDYPDDKLNKIIEDTYSFARDIINNANLDWGVWELDIDEDKIDEINLFLCGGRYSDTIFFDNDGRHISKYILKTLFGKRFLIEINTERIERESDDPDIVSIYERFYLYMQGIPKDIEGIKKELFKDEKTLKK